MAVSLLIQALRAPWRQVPWRRAVNAFRPIDPHSGSLPWWTTFLLWQFLAWFLGFRRWSGGLAVPPTGWLLVVSVSCAVLLASVLRLSHPGSRRPTGLAAGPHGWLAAANFAFLAALTFPQTSIVATVAAWSLVVASETWWLPRPPFLARGPSSHSSPIATTSPATNQPVPAPHIRPRIDWESESLPTDVSQQWIRSQSAEGDRLIGLLRIDFPPSQRTQQVHLPFCPPFVAKPAVQVVQMDGPAARLQVSQIETFGVRLEVKLERAAPSPTDVVVELSVGEDRRDSPEPMPSSRSPL